MGEDAIIGELLQNTFFRNNAGRFQDAQSRGINFVHYTTADTLNRILDSKSVYLRNTRVLNDSSEIKFGYAFLKACALSPEGNDLFDAINAIDNSLSRQVVLDEYFKRQHYPNIAQNTFVFSMSEFDAEPKSNLGMLSMWRAYGGSSGVALVIDAGKTAFIESDAAGAWTFPVEYVECTESWAFPRDNWLCKEFGHIAVQLHRHRDVLRKIEAGRIIGPLMQTFYLSILRSKHAAFREEREWRVIRTPGRMDSVKAGAPTVETIGGIPQQVVKLRLQNYPDGTPNPLNLELSNILKALLIGPCDHAEVIRDAFVSKLRTLGIVNADSKVILTNIPYRPNQR